MPADFASMTPAILDELVAMLGSHAVSADAIQSEAHSHDVSGHPPHRADAIVWPQTAEQVAQVLKFASDRRIAVTPWGAGTSVEGNPIPVCGGILLSLEQMHRILAIHAEDMQATVEAGVKYRDLNRELVSHGLFFPVDPGGDATIGGTARPRRRRQRSCAAAVSRCGRLRGCAGVQRRLG